MEPNGHWRIVTIPLQCADQVTKLESGTKMDKDGLHLVSQSPVGSLKGNQQKARCGPTADCSFSIKSITASGNSRSNFQRQSRRKCVANKVNESDRSIVGSSSENNLIRNKNLISSPSGHDAIDSSEIHLNAAKGNGALRGSSRKKGRKRGKRNKNLLGNTSYAIVESTHGTSKSCSSYTEYMDQGVVSLLHETKLAVVSLPGNKRDGKYSGVSSDDSMDFCAAPRMSKGYIKDSNMLETPVSSASGNFSSEDLCTNSGNVLQTQNSGFSTLNGISKNTHSKKIICANNSYSKIFPETDDSLLLDSASLVSNSDQSSDTNYDKKVSNEENGGSNISESPIGIVRKSDFSLGNLSNIVAKPCGYSDRTNYNEQECTDSDRHSKTVENREKQIKRLPNNLSISRISSAGKLHGCSGRDSNHMVWQKVQKTEADKSNNEMKKVKVLSRFDLRSNEAPLLNKNHHVTSSASMTKSEDKVKKKVKVSGKLKRKTTPRSKQECNSFSRTEEPHSKPTLDSYTQINTQQKGIINASSQQHWKKELTSGSGSQLKTCNPGIGSQDERIECCTFRPCHNSQVCPNKLESFESIDDTVPKFDDHIAKPQNSLLSTSCNFLDPQRLVKGFFAVRPSVQMDDDICATSEGEVSPADDNKQETGTRAILQKWVPIGVKDSILPSTSHSISSSTSEHSETTSEIQNFKHIRNEEFSCDSRACVSSVNPMVLCREYDFQRPSEGEVAVQELRNLRTHLRTKYCSSHATAECLLFESHDSKSCASRVDSSNIVCAVNDAHKAQMASEAIQRTTGCPIAEIEKLLQLASPVICLPNDTANCKACLHNSQGVGSSSLCRHEIPNVTLGRLWQWYEEHGIYGLEVRAEDYENSKRIGVDRFAFRAYFVPYLSAIQLFRKGRSYPSTNENRVSGVEAEVGSEIKQTSKNTSYIGHLPILSVLVPQPCTEDSSLSPENLVSSNESSMCVEANVSALDSKWCDDVELLFEYFESEQPQRRRPFFEMILELLSGDGPSQCRAFGNSTILDSMGLFDLHPDSWYSVAWYPIYRIPDGNFRAAFLTYHSLGHLVHQGPTSDSPLGVDAFVVSPVVGLESYSAQGECWFHPRYTMHSHSEGVTNLDPSEVLRERLRTLKQTACVMARAAISKGSETSVNRQPDYEFFLSRRR